MSETLRAVRSSRAASPAAKDAINAAVDLFHRRWVLRILWELRGEPMTFRALQAACADVSPSVLNQRLAELRAAQLVEHEARSGYRLSPHGRDLVVAMQPLTRWAKRWWREVGAVTSG